jgi:hypothetical protein
MPIHGTVCLNCISAHDRPSASMQGAGSFTACADSAEHRVPVPAGACVNLVYALRTQHVCWLFHAGCSQPDNFCQLFWGDSCGWHMAAASRAAASGDDTRDFTLHGCKCCMGGM